MTISAVVFDVGGTLVDEARMLGGWARSLGVPVPEFYAALGAVIAGRGHHREVFALAAPGADLPAIRARRAAAGEEFRIGREDLYPDVLDCLRACRAAGLFVGIAGNQPDHAEAALGAILAAESVAVDLLAASDRWGVAKPDPAFFGRVAEACGRPPAEIAYVGDRVDNDVGPARAFGMIPVLLRRGPWGIIQSAWPEAAEAALVVDGLGGLPQALAGL